jgi:hypothetical protein
LIEQRLEEMEVAAVDERDIYWGVAQRLGRVEPAEPSTENDHAVHYAGRAHGPASTAD